MTIRVVHIFAPNFKRRFGGPIFDWKYAFSRWNDPEIEHLVFDYDTKQLGKANDVFDFHFPSSQESVSRIGRAAWTLYLTQNLSRLASDYDMIHFHVLWWGSLIAAGWAKKHSIPTVYQSVLLDSDTPGNIRKERFGKIKVNLLKNFSCILAISDFLAQDYLENGFIKEQVVTLMNSVDTSLFQPLSIDDEKTRLRQRFGLPINSTILIFVGSVIQRKGVDVLVEAFKQVSQNIPDVFLLLVGPHTKHENPSLDENWIVALQNSLAEANLTSRTSFLGLVSDRQVLADLYRASDLFVFPSRVEGLGNVILEAMASGLPVVVSDLPVFEGVIRHNENGVTVPVEDIPATAQAIIKLINAPILAEEYGRKAREDAVQNFSFSSWQSRLVEVYQRLITDKLSNDGEILSRRK